jgi:hypothetical protein
MLEIVSQSENHKKNAWPKHGKAKCIARNVWAVGEAHQHADCLSSAFHGWICVWLTFLKSVSPWTWTNKAKNQKKRITVTHMQGTLILASYCIHAHLVSYWTDFFTPDRLCSHNFIIFYEQSIYSFQ